MSKGKQKCMTLKAIRRSIAEANGISYAPAECHDEGDCKGTCPQCEAEVRYLERQLDLRRAAGRAVTLVGLSAGMLSLSPSVSAQTANSALTEALADSCRDPLEIDYNIPMGEMPVEKTAEVFGDIAEAQPQFPGGQEALMSYIDKAVAELVSERLEEIEPDTPNGRCVVTFTIDEHGAASAPVVVKSLGDVLDSIAIDVVKRMPRWTPMRVNGVAKAAKYTLPISFRFKD